MEIEEGEYYSLMNRENLKGGEKNHRSENPWKAPPPPPSSLPPGGRGDSVPPPASPLSPGAVGVS